MRTPTRNTDIRHINPAVAECTPPQATGTSYRLKAPDTLDLAERARHMLNALTETTDPAANAEIYWHTQFGWKPPTMYHDASDWVEYKYYAPSVLLRQACGSDQRMDVEWHRMANLLQMQGPDGLMYVPLTGRPWGSSFGGDDYMYRTDSSDYLIPAALMGRLLEASATYFRLTDDLRWLEIGKRMINGLPRILVDRGDYAYLNKTTFQPGESPPRDDEIPPPTRTHGTAWLSMGLTTFYRMCGYEPARELGLKLARFYQFRHGGFIGPYGEFQLSHGSKDFDITQPCHFHMNTLTRVMLLYAGLANSEPELINLARAGYEFGRAHGQTLMGYFPEFLWVGDKHGGYGHTTEFCEAAEMIYLATEFSKFGVSDCWDDADRWLRNIFAEGQLLNTDWVQAYSERHGVERTHPYGETANVAERFRGTVGGWIAANDWQGRTADSVMTCCLGNAAIMLYRVWRDMITEDPKRKRLNVHLLMNRACNWADVHSLIPNRGQVDVKLKRACEVALRMPEWVRPANCALTRNGQPTRPTLEGRYLVTPAGADDELSLRFPIAERTEKLHIEGTDYRAVVRGNEIVDIDPPGARCPIFQRPELRTDEPQWRTVQRFVSETTLETY